MTENQIFEWDIWLATLTYKEKKDGMTVIKKKNRPVLIISIDEPPLLLKSLQSHHTILEIISKENI